MEAGWALRADGSIEGGDAGGAASAATPQCPVRARPSRTFALEADRPRREQCRPSPEVVWASCPAAKLWEDLELPGERQLEVQILSPRLKQPANDVVLAAGPPGPVMRQAQTVGACARSHIPLARSAIAATTVAPQRPQGVPLAPWWLGPDVLRRTKVLAVGPDWRRA